jgi:hypothetical protein
VKHVALKLKIIIIVFIFSFFSKLHSNSIIAFVTFVMRLLWLTLVYLNYNMINLMYGNTYIERFWLWPGTFGYMSKRVFLVVVLYMLYTITLHLIAKCHWTCWKKDKQLTVSVRNISYFSQPFRYLGKYSYICCNYPCIIWSVLFKHVLMLQLSTCMYNYCCAWLLS